MVMLSNRIMSAPYIDVGDTSDATPTADLSTDLREPLPGNWTWSSLQRPGYLRIKSAATGWLRVDTDLSTPTSPRDTVLAIYWRNPDTGVFEQIASDDDSGLNFASVVVFKAGVDATYFVQVVSYNGSAPDAYVVRVAETTAPTPAFDFGSGSGSAGQDAFADAGVWLPGTGYNNFTPTSATVEAGEPLDLYQSSVFASPGGLDTKSLWWKVQPQSTGLMQVYCSAGMVAMFTGDSLATLDLVQLRFNNGNSSCRMNVYVQAGTSYYLRWSDASATTTSYTVGISKVLAVTEAHSPFLNAHTNVTITTGNGSLTGGGSALADNSDATYAEVYAWTSTDSVANKQFSFTLNPLTVDQSRIVAVHIRMRARFPGQPADEGGRGPGLANFYNGSNTINNYSLQSWRWKPTEWHDHILDATTGSGGYLIPFNMLLGGTSAVAGPGESWQWGDGVHEQVIDLTWYGTGSASGEYAQVSEAEFIVYMWDDVDVAVMPPDEVGAIDGAQDIDRAAFSQHK